MDDKPTVGELTRPVTTVKELVDAVGRGEGNDAIDKAILELDNLVRVRMVLTVMTDSVEKAGSIPIALAYRKADELIQDLFTTLSGASFHDVMNRHMENSKIGMTTSDDDAAEVIAALGLYGVAMCKAGAELCGPASGSTIHKFNEKHGADATGLAGTLLMLGMSFIRRGSILLQNDEEIYHSILGKLGLPLSGDKLEDILASVINRVS